MVLLGLAHRTQVEGWGTKLQIWGEMDTDMICKEVFAMSLFFMTTLTRIVKEEPAKMVQRSLVTLNFSSSQQQGGRR